MADFFDKPLPSRKKIKFYETVKFLITCQASQ